MTGDTSEETGGRAFRVLWERLAARRPDTETAGILGAVSGGVALFFGGFVIAQHTGAYQSAGVRGEVAFVGSLVAQLVVGALLFIATALVLHGDRRRAFWMAGVGGVVALGFALLPTLVDQRGGWLSVLLLVLITLVLDVAMGVAVFFIAFFAGLGYKPSEAA